MDEGAPPPGGEGTAALVVLCTASFLAVTDTTIVTVALPSMRASLGFTPTSVQWVLNGYALIGLGTVAVGLVAMAPGVAV